MNFSKKGPYILIILLVILLIFILGVQYGKRIKVADTAIAILLSITPSPSPKPTQTQVTNFTHYSHKECNVSFLYPSYLKKESESSQEAKFTSTDKKQFIKLLCPKQFETTNIGSASATLTIDGFQANSKNETMKVNNTTVKIQVIRINRTNNPIEFTVNTELAPLITTSTEFN